MEEAEEQRAACVRKRESWCIFYLVKEFVLLSLRCPCDVVASASVTSHASACVTSLMRAHLSPHSFERQSARASLTCQVGDGSGGYKKSLLDGSRGYKKSCYRMPK